MRNSHRWIWSWLLCTLAGLTSTHADEAIVTIESAEVKGDGRVVGRVTGLTRLTIEQQNGGWLLITIPGTTTKGWISEKDVMIVRSMDEPATSNDAARLNRELLNSSDPLTGSRTAPGLDFSYNLPVVPLEDVIVVVEAARVTGGKRTLGTIPKGTRIAVQDSKGVWLLVTIPGTKTQGWVNYLDVLPTQPRSLSAEIEHLPEEASALIELLSKSSDQFREAKDPDLRAAALVRLTAVNRKAYFSALANAQESTEAKSFLPKLRETFLTHANLLAGEWENRREWHPLLSLLKEMRTATAAQWTETDWRVVEIDARLKLATTLKDCSAESLQKFNQAAQDLSRASTLHSAGRFQKAIEIIEAARAAILRAVGSDNIAYLQCLGNLGVLYANAGNHERALMHHKRAVEGKRRILGASHPDYALSLGNLAQTYEAAGDRAQAGPLLEEAMRVMKAARGREHPDYALTANNFAEYLRRSGQYDQAEPLYTEALQILRKSAGPKSPGYATCLGNLATLHQTRGRLDQAERLFREVLELQKESIGEAHPGYAKTLNNLATLYLEQGNLQAAEEISLQSCRISENSVGERHPDYALQLINLASVRSQRSNFAEAEETLRRALEILKTTVGEEHPTCIVAYGQLAQLHQSRGDFPAAESHLQLALKLQLALTAKQHPDVALRMNNLGEFHRELSNRPQAEEYLREACRIWKETLGETHPQYAVGLNNLAAFFEDAGDYTRAEPLYQQALAIRKEALGEQHPDYALSLSNLGVLYHSLGDSSRALKLVQEAVETEQKIFGERHPRYAIGLHNLAALYEATGDHAAALEQARKALQIREVVLGKRHPDYANSLDQVAGLHLQSGDGLRSEPLYEQALEIRQSVLGEQHPACARSLNNLSTVSYINGDYARSETLLQQALEIHRAAQGASHPETLEGLRNHLLLQAAQSRWEAARMSAEACMAGTLKHLSQVLPGLSEREQQQFLVSKFEPTLAAVLSLPLAVRGDSQIDQAAADWLLNGKGRGVEALAERARLARDLDDPRSRDALRALLNVRQRLARLTLAPPDDAAQFAAHKAQLESLTEEEQRLIKQIAQIQGEATRAGESRISLAEVRSALPNDGVLIDIARFRIADFPRRRFSEPHYVAWLIFPRSSGKDVRVIDLGPASDVDEAVHAFQETIQKTGEIFIDEGEAAAEQALADPLSKLARLVIAPLQQHIEDRPRWFVSPDAALWLVPWETLPVAAGRYALEDHAVSYLISGRDLVRGGNQQESRTPGILVADPDFDGRPGVPSANVGESPQGSSRTSRAGVRGDWGRLFGAAEEAQAVLPLLTRLLGAKPAVYQRGEAVEAVIKHADRPRVAVFCTHGFFLPDQPDTTRESVFQRGMIADDLALAPQSENPLLRCGLILSGANRQDIAASSDDGILTGLEIVGSDLRGTELVVLSACETGLGVVQNGQGVAGLRQAFQLAGAQTVISTLWKVPDAETSDLMQSFWQRLAAGESKAQALRSAKLDMIARRRAEGAAHPYFWAAFTLTGQDGMSR